MTNNSQEGQTKGKKNDGKIKKISFILDSLKQGDNMKKLVVLLLSIFAINSLLTSCSTTRTAQPVMPAPVVSKPENMTVAEVAPNTHVGYMSGAPVASNPVGGNIHNLMDKSDRSKMSKGLDGGLGKATHWVNNRTSISYTVTPTAKLTLKGNPFCRKYNLSADNHGHVSQFSGTACLESDGEWHPAS